MLKVFQPMNTPVGTNEQTGVNTATVTASGNFQSRGLAAACSSALFILNVTAATGTSPSLTVSVQGRDPLSLVWIPLGSFPAQTAVSAAPLTLELNPLYFEEVRVAYTVSGATPSFTFQCGAFYLNSETPG